MGTKGATTDRPMPRNNTDPRVDVFIEALPEWQQAICRKVRDLAHAADPELEETIKRKRQPYFVLKGNVCALLAAKDWDNVFLYDGAIVPDPQGINGSSALVLHLPVRGRRRRLRPADEQAFRTP